MFTLWSVHFNVYQQYPSYFRAILHDIKQRNKMPIFWGCWKTTCGCEVLWMVRIFKAHHFVPSRMSSNLSADISTSGHECTQSKCRIIIPDSISFTTCDKCRNSNTLLQQARRKCKAEEAKLAEDARRASRTKQRKSGTSSTCSSSKSPPGSDFGGSSEDEEGDNKSGSGTCDSVSPQSFK